MAVAWSKGITPHQYRKCYVKDIVDVEDILDAVKKKGKTDAEVEKLLNQMRSKR